MIDELAFLSKGDRLVALSWDGVLSGNTEEERAKNLLQIWDLQGPRVTATATGMGTMRAISVATGADLIATVNMDGQLSVRTLPLFEAKWSVEVGDVTNVSITRDGRHVLVGDGKGRVRMFDGAAGKLQWTRKVLAEFVMDLGFSSSGRYFAIGGTDKRVPVFDGSTRNVITQVATAAPTDERSGGIYALAFSPDDKWLATADGDDQVRLFSLPSGRLVRSLKASMQPLALAWSPDSATLAVGGSYGSSLIKLVNIATGNVAELPTDHTLAITALAWSPDGLQIASGSRDKTIRLHNAPTKTR